MINNILKYKNYFIIIGLYLLFVLLISICNWFFLSINISKYFIFISTIVLAIIIGFKEGKKRNNKGYLGGLKTSIILLLIINLIDLIFSHNPLNIKRIIYYFIIILVSILSSIIGINKKAN